MAYKCDSCGNTSDEQADCCGAPMKEVSEDSASEGTGASAE